MHDLELRIRRTRVPKSLMVLQSKIDAVEAHVDWDKFREKRDYRDGDDDKFRSRFAKARRSIQARIKRYFHGLENARNMNARNV
jgi:hypothetical protein